MGFCVCSFFFWKRGAGLSVAWGKKKKRLWGKKSFFGQRGGCLTVWGGWIFGWGWEGKDFVVVVVLHPFFFLVVF